MSITANSGLSDRELTHDHAHHHHHAAISWKSITGGVFLSMAITIVMVILGSSLELSTVSPWSANAGTLGTFSVKVVIWSIVVQWAAAGMGGFFAGRLRCTKSDLNDHEGFFRDTAHGLLTWAVATVVMFGVFASTGAAIVGTGVKAASTMSADATAGEMQSPSANPSEPSAYVVDTLLRPAAAGTAASPQDQHVEVTRILANSLKNDGISDGDRTYLAAVVAARAGISEPDAEKRVDDTIVQIKETKQKALEDADAARKAMLKMSIYLVLSLFIGAFVASAAAALGGSHREEFRRLTPKGDHYA